MKKNVPFSSILSGKNAPPAEMDGNPQWGDSGVYITGQAPPVQTRDGTPSPETLHRLDGTDINMPNLSTDPRYQNGTTDNIQGFPEMSGAHKYSLFLSNLLAGNLPENQRSVDSPAMKNIIMDYQQTQLKNYMLLKMQAAQGWYQKKHGTKKEWAI